MYGVKPATIWIAGRNPAAAATSYNCSDLATFASDKSEQIYPCKIKLLIKIQFQNVCFVYLLQNRVNTRQADKLNQYDFFPLPIQNI